MIFRPTGIVLEIVNATPHIRRIRKYKIYCGVIRTVRFVQGNPQSYAVKALAYYNTILCKTPALIGYTGHVLLGLCLVIE